MRNRFYYHLYLSFFFLLVLTAATVKAQELSLAGTWRFATDREDRGTREEWFKKDLSGETIQLPGSMAENLKGDDVTLHTKWTANIYDSSWFFNPRMAEFRQPGNIKIPFWLTPVKYYVGPAWYQKEVEIPAEWKGKRLELFLERAHIITRLWIDGKEIGKENSLVAPHVYVLPDFITPGKHTFTLRVDNTIHEEVNVGLNSHSISDHTQGNWNGLIGDLLLKARPLVFFEDIQIYPDLAKQQAVVKLKVMNSLPKDASVSIDLGAKSFNTKKDHQVKASNKRVTLKTGSAAELEMVLPMGDKMLTWDEFDPALYQLTASLEGPKGLKESMELQFGMREIKADGTRLSVNGRPVFLRGTLNNCEFPLTGYPAMDVAAWEKLWNQAKAHGLNHIRFHSWCPPEAAFIAADKVGMYLQPEGPTWPNHSTSLGDGRAIDQYVYEETNRMAKEYGNYASFVMMAAGNEPRGGNQAAYLADFIKYWQEKDPRRVYTGASVAMSWPLVPQNEFMVKSGPRGLDWSKGRPETESNYLEKIKDFNVPYVTHEMGQWVAFPNFEEIAKYSGVYKAKNFELFQADLEDRGMGEQAKDFLMASGNLQVLCYKAEIEKSLRTPGLAGFQLLGLQDFPGQGTALVGVIDAFWESKGYITAEQFSRFCNTTVPLSRIPKFVYSNNESFEAGVELYHFGKTALEDATLSWTIKNEKGQEIGSGTFSPRTYPIGSGHEVGKLSLPLSSLREAAKLTLELKVEGTDFVNDWDFWVYPQSLPKIAPDEIYYATQLDAKAEAVLQKGGKVFLDAAGQVVKGKEVSMYFTPVFWNTSWFKMRPPHVTGFLAKADHPAFKYFPTEYHSNFQWWEIVNRAQVMHLEDFPKDFRPLVQPIDTWFMNRRLGLIFEASVGNGKLLVSSADLTSDLENRHAARQLYYSIRKYMASDDFKPEDKLDLALLKDIFQTPSRETWDSYTKDSPDELKPLHQKKN